MWHKIGKTFHRLTLTLILAHAWSYADSHAAESHGVAAAATGGGARLEIRQHRFGKHGGYDRLVFEFDQKEGADPHVRVEKSSNPREVLVHIEKAALVGAVSEDLINESFKKKSKFLSTVDVDTESTPEGFTFRIGLKGGATHATANWLTHPSRLAIDVHGDGSMAAVHRGSLSIARNNRHPSFSDLFCFPAASKVGVTVIFQPKSAQYDELQNIRVNTDGSTPSEGSNAPDAIVCYPKKSLVQATLSFEETLAQNLFGSGAKPQEGEHAATAEHAQPATNDSDLDPGPLLPGRKPSSQKQAHPAPAAGHH